MRQGEDDDGIFKAKETMFVVFLANDEAEC